MGREVFSFTAQTAAFISRESDMVSMITKSAPACSAATAVTEKAFTASSKVTVPIGASSCPKGPISKATNLSSKEEAALLAAAIPA